MFTHFHARKSQTQLLGKVSCPTLPLSTPDESFHKLELEIEHHVISIGARIQKARKFSCSQIVYEFETYRLLSDWKPAEKPPRYCDVTGSHFFHTIDEVNQFHALQPGWTIQRDNWEASSRYEYSDWTNISQEAFPGRRWFTEQRFGFGRFVPWCMYVCPDMIFSDKTQGAI